MLCWPGRATPCGGRHGTRRDFPTPPGEVRGSGSRVRDPAAPQTNPVRGRNATVGLPRDLAGGAPRFPRRRPGSRKEPRRPPFFCQKPIDGNVKGVRRFPGRPGPLVLQKDGWRKRNARDGSNPRLHVVAPGVPHAGAGATAAACKRPERRQPRPDGTRPGWRIPAACRAATRAFRQAQRHGSPGGRSAALLIAIPACICDGELLVVGCL
jgi:hypothetical protein